MELQSLRHHLLRVRQISQLSLRSPINLSPLHHKQTHDQIRKASQNLHQQPRQRPLHNQNLPSPNPNHRPNSGRNLSLLKHHSQDHSNNNSKDHNLDQLQLPQDLNPHHSQDHQLSPGQHLHLPQITSGKNDTTSRLLNISCLISQIYDYLLSRLIR